MKTSLFTTRAFMLLLATACSAAPLGTKHLNTEGGFEEEADTDTDTDTDADADADADADVDTGSYDTAIVLDDSDGDTIADVDEEGADTDGDGTDDDMDLDSDEDGIPDEVEAGDEWTVTPPIDTDGDGIPDFRDEDSDGDGILDRIESGDTPLHPHDTDEDGIPDYIDVDSDDDGIPDSIEAGDGALPVDSDGDGRPDYRDPDSDGDGIWDEWEHGTGTHPADTDGDGIPDYLDDDSDGDGIPDAVEGEVTTPGEEPRDTDGDGEYDFVDEDSDDDGLTDTEEREETHTDAYDPDTDGDGATDGAEVSIGTDPFDPSSTPEHYIEISAHSEGASIDFSFDIEVRQADVGFLLDTTCSMSGTMSAMAAEFSAIVTDLSGTIPDAEYGYATYDDYAYGSFGYASSGDKPFILQSQITSATSRVQSAMSGSSIHFGGDGPESGMEALYQATTGIGYDQDCDGSWDPGTDVQPLRSRSSDPFGGSAGSARDFSVPGGGEVGGFGFREDALPIIVYATDNYLRDPSAGYGSPGGCPRDAARADVASATTGLGARLIGVDTSGLATTQMETLSDLTSSFADLDGDGVTDDRLVLRWSGSSASFRSTIVDAISDLVNSVEFSTIELVVTGDTYGFVDRITPAAFTSVSMGSAGTTLTFTIHLVPAVAPAAEDRVFHIGLRVLGDGTTLLAEDTLVVVVPGA